MPALLTRDTLRSVMNARLAPHWCSAAGPQIPWCPAPVMDEQLGLSCVSRAQAPALLSQGIGTIPRGWFRETVVCPPGPALWLTEELSLVCSLWAHSVLSQLPEAHASPSLPPPPAAVPPAAFLSDLSNHTPSCWEPCMLWETGQ